MVYGCYAFTCFLKTETLRPKTLTLHDTPLPYDDSKIFKQGDMTDVFKTLRCNFGSMEFML